jgi:hypothetical protein
MRSRIRLKRQFKVSPKKYYKGRPIPPRSVIMVRKDNPGPHRSLLGIILRVGYYSKQDGTNVIWLVYPDGGYAEATTHALLNRHFTVLSVSENNDLFGVTQPEIQPLSAEEISAY